MYRFYLTFLLSLFIYGQTAQAYEFQQMSHVFDLLQTEYSGCADFKQIAIAGNHSLSSYDPQIKVYYSDTKAFLYYKKKLIDQFILPEESSSPLWKNFVADVFHSALEYSPLLKKHQSELETKVVECMLQNLDKYSRFENKLTKQASLVTTLKHNSLYVKLTSFTDGQAAALKQIIEQYPNIDGIILDLRDNHGGKFSEALKIADLFLDSALITYSQEKNRTKRYYTSHAGDVLNGKPIAILTNEFTASAAEVVVIALKEQSRAVLIGAKTYGKNSIQQVHSIGGKILYLTHGQFYSPSGKDISHVGVKPQICTTTDSQCAHSDPANLEKDIAIALEFIKNHIS